MYKSVPEHYDETYRWYTRRGSRVLALGTKTMSLQADKVYHINTRGRSALMSFQVNQVPRDTIECDLDFAGFLVFHCPLKPDAIETLRMLADSSHRVGRAYP